MPSQMQKSETIGQIEIKLWFILILKFLHKKVYTLVIFKCILIMELDKQEEVWDISQFLKACPLQACEGNAEVMPGYDGVLLGLETRKG